MMGKRPVVFLDRDGTINVEKGYLDNVEDLELIPGAAQAISILNANGIAAIVATNQSGPARGLYPESHVKALHARLIELLAAAGARLDAIYYCPHLAEGVVAEYALSCVCRKPHPGMVQQAFFEHSDLDPSRAYVVGDRSTDIDLARNAALKAILVKTGYGEDVLAGRHQWIVTPDYVGKDLPDAVGWILAELGRQDKR